MITRVVARENEKCSNEKVVQWYAKGMRSKKVSRMGTERAD